MTETTEMTARRKKAFEELEKQFKTLTEMAEYFGVSSPAISRWKRSGIPKGRVPYFMLKYPKFEAWKGLPRGV
jgi:hypothetical protein|nr:MAG TPA: excisionase [Caudoviricetes sp.]